MQSYPIRMTCAACRATPSIWAMKRLATAIKTELPLELKVKTKGIATPDTWGATPRRSMDLYISPTDTALQYKSNTLLSFFFFVLFFSFFFIKKTVSTRQSS